MRKETITYKDYDGEERTEDFYFNLNKAELLEMEMSWDGGLQKVLRKITQERDNKRIIEMFKMIILRAYGEKSLDGRRFLKVDDDGRSLAQKNFVPTEAYSYLFTKLATDDKYAADFVNQIIPENADDEVADKKEPAKVLPGPGADTAAIEKK